MRYLFILLTIPFIYNCAQVQKTLFTPSGIEQYCRRISGDSDEESLNTCISQEHSAKKELSRMTIPQHIENRCRKLSESTGGSYQVMLTCVQQEMPLKKRGK